VREVLARASVAWCGRERALTNGVLDYAAEVEGCPLHDGWGGAGDRGRWLDPPYPEVGSCSRVSGPPVRGAGSGGPGWRRELSFVSLDRPNWIPPDGWGSLTEQVTTPLRELPERHDHLYGWLPLMFRFCRNRVLAYFSRYEPGPEIHRLAALHDVEVLHFPLDTIPREQRERHRWIDG
jgi:hypothetical protein